MKDVIKLLTEILNLQRGQKEVFNMDDFCFYTGFSKHYAYHLTSTNKIKFYRPSGKQIFFDADDVKCFLRKNPVEEASHINKKCQDRI